MRLFDKNDSKRISRVDALASTVIINSLKEYSAILRTKLNGTSAISMERLEIHYKVEALEEIANLINKNITDAGFTSPNLK